MQRKSGWWWFVLLWTWVAVSNAQESQCPPALDFELRTLAGNERVRLCESYLGKVVLLVNTASRCAFTPQYEYLLDRQGRLVGSYSSFVAPESRELVEAIESLL